MKSRANAFQSVEDLRSKFTAESGYSAFEVSEWRGRVSTCLDTRNTRGGDRSEEFHRETRIFSEANRRRGSWRMLRFFNNPHPSPLPKVFHGIRPFEKLDEWLFESLKASIDLAPLTF